MVRQMHRREGVCVEVEWKKDEEEMKWWMLMCV